MTTQISSNATKQFNFARHWRSKIAPLLDDPEIIKALTVGLMLHDPTYKEGDPPWCVGRGPLNGQRARRGCLSWYQPLGRCHFIAPFCWALGRELFPDRNWGFITSDGHTVVIGFLDNWQEPEVVMDILLFRQMSAQESLEFAEGEGCQFYDSLVRYVASFYTDPEHAFRILTGCHTEQERTGAWPLHGSAV